MNTPFHLLSQPAPSLESSGREPLIDVLRGYALFGVFLVRMVEYFSGWQTEGASAGPVDEFLHMAFSIFSNNKFRSLFSFLFGLGFYYQLQKSTSFQLSGDFLKKLIILMGFGLLHAYFVWSGDILHWYALAGLVLLLLHRLTTRSLLLMGLFLSALVPALHEILNVLLIHSEPTSVSRMYTPGNPSYFEMLKHNFITTNYSSFRSWGAVSFILSIAGYFLLGLWAGRVQLLRQLLQNTKLCTKVVLWTLLVGLTSGLVVVVFPAVLEANLLPRRGWVLLFWLGFSQLNTTAIFIFHVGLVSLLFAYPMSNQWLRKLIPAGKMTLTNYIMQSVIGVWVFNGFGLGLWGALPLPAVIALTVGVFGLQMSYSRWWLHHFKAGPLETLWRQLTKSTFRFPFPDRHTALSGKE
jgi:uncharacterized protein